MKKIFALLIAALLTFTAPAYAEIATTQTADHSAKIMGASAEKFYASLPKAKGEYKSRKRPILLEGAMNIETEILVRALKNPVVYHDLHYLFIAGTYKDYPVVVARTEQGMKNAAVSTALAIKKFNPVAVINQGTAGGYEPSLSIGTIIVGEKSLDTSAIMSSYTKAGASFDPTDYEFRGTYAYDAESETFRAFTDYSADPTLFNITFAVANCHGEFKVLSGIIGSSNRWTNWVDFIDKLNDKYGILCEEMETASAAQICHTAGVPFIGIRVISNNITIGKHFEPKSADIAQEFVLLVVEDYINKILRR